MIAFKPIALSDRDWIEALLKKGNQRGSEYAFSNNFNYREIYHIEVAQLAGYYLVRSGKGEERSYLCPSGEGAFGPVIEALMEDAAVRGARFVMHAITAGRMEQLESIFPGVFHFEAVRDNFDYLYESEKLAALSGKKLHSKRNFINRFLSEWEDNWSYEQITPQNLAECWEMNVEWCRQMGCGKDPSLQEESCAVRSCFEHFEALGLVGGLLRAGGRIVAYSMGRPLCEDTFIVHIEKAFAQIAGAYPMMNQQFVRHNCMQYRYVNREDDVGDEGLRKAKLSYKPAILLEKYVATLSENR